MGRAVYIGAPILAAEFAFLLFVSFQSSVGPDSKYSLGWFRSSTGNVSNEYPTPITPASYAFSIWGIIYLWNIAWIFYVLTTLCRTNRAGPVYLNPPATSFPFLLAIFLGYGFTTAWLFLWDREFMIAAAVDLALSCVAVYLALLISVKQVFEYLCTFKRIASGDLWAYRILVNNGLAIFAAWITVACQINLCLCLMYIADVPSDTATYICLSILSAEIIIYFILDIFIIDSYTRFVFMVYPTFIWALTAVLINNKDDPTTPEFIFSTVLLGVCTILFAVKTTVMFIAAPVAKGNDGTVNSSSFKFKQLQIAQ